MPINFDLENVRANHGCSVYFETGLWDPRDDVSCKKALQCNFDSVNCIEIREDWVELGKEVFADDIEKGRCRLIRDDSTNMASHFPKDEWSGAKVLFFLDAHVDNSNIHNYRRRCPLFEELDAISGLARKDHLILVDDLRILRNEHPWGENSFQNINFVEKIVEKILEINPRYEFKTLNGHVDDDVLFAYVPTDTIELENDS